MLKARSWIIIMMFFLLTLGVTGCSDKLSIGLTHDLQIASDTKLGFVTLIDSRTGQAKYLRSTNGGTSMFFNEAQPASEITEVTTISVIGISGIAGSQSCNYITIDSRHVGSMEERVICRRNNELRETNLQDSDIPTLPQKLMNRLAEAGDINNLGFLILTDAITGKTKLFMHKDYTERPFKFPLSITEVRNNNSWSVITFKENPCRQCSVNSNGQEHCWYVTYCPS